MYVRRLPEVILCQAEFAHPQVTGTQAIPGLTRQPTQGPNETATPTKRCSVADLPAVLIEKT